MLCEVGTPFWHGTIFKQVICSALLLQKIRVLWSLLLKYALTMLSEPSQGSSCPSAASEPIAHTHLSLGPRGCLAHAPLPGPFLCCHRRWAAQFSFDHCSWHPAPWSHPLPCPRGEESAGFNLAKELCRISNAYQLSNQAKECTGQSQNIQDGPAAPGRRGADRTAEHHSSSISIWPWVLYQVSWYKLL